MRRAAETVRGDLPPHGDDANGWRVSVNESMRYHLTYISPVQLQVRLLPSPSGFVAVATPNHTVLGPWMNRNSALSGRTYGTH